MAGGGQTEHPVAIDAVEDVFGEVPRRGKRLDGIAAGGLADPRQEAADVVTPPGNELVDVIRTMIVRRRQAEERRGRPVPGRVHGVVRRAGEPGEAHPPGGPQSLGRQGPHKGRVAVEMQDRFRPGPGGGVELHDLLGDPAADRPPPERQVDVPPGQEEAPAPFRAWQRHLAQPAGQQLLLRYEGAPPPGEGPEQGNVRRRHGEEMRRPGRGEAVGRLAQQAAAFEIAREGQGDQGRRRTHA